MKENHIAIICTDIHCEAQATQLAHELGLPIIPIKFQQSQYTLKSTIPFDYLLTVTPDYIGLQNTQDKKFSPYYIDFLSGKSRYRKEQATRRNELLARAIGVRPQDNPIIVDATAGLGRDSMVLATLGFSITMIERSPILFVLLRNALDRARKDASMFNIVSRLELVHADAIEWLANRKQIERPEVIYMDPMFPSRKKAAAIKKEMVILQALLGKEEDAAELLAIARQTANKRVVVKRPRLAASVDDLAASYSVLGKSSRFDIYLVANHGNLTNSD